MATGGSPDTMSYTNCPQKTCVVILDKQTNDDSVMWPLIESIFSSDSSTLNTQSLPAKLCGLSSYIATCLDESLITDSQLITVVESASGRLGPTDVRLNASGCCGLAVIAADLLTMSSKSSLFTIRANACVYAGKWMYEVTLCSMGVMQFGWSSTECEFMASVGVGDTHNSYSFDGNRVCRWNSRMQTKYGESWLTNDVIGVTIDCDLGVVSFSRNGHSLGDAFTNVRLGPGFAYFPAVTLTLSESVRVNFGNVPFRYPITGYCGLQAPPIRDVIKSRVLVSFIDRLLPLLVERRHCQLATSDDVTDNEVTTTNVYIIAAHVINYLAPLLMNAYTVEETLFPLLVKSCTEQRVVHSLLDVMLALLQEQELTSCLQHLINCLLSRYLSPVDCHFSHQKKYLSVLQCLVNHGRMRKYLLQNVFFEKAKLPLFLHIRSLDNSVLVELIPTVWWSKTQETVENNSESETPEVVLNEDEVRRKTEYLAARSQLCNKVAEIETIQINLLVTLLTCDDATDQDTATSRSIFVYKFRQLLKEHFFATHIKVDELDKCSTSVLLCLLYRLTSAVKFYCNSPGITCAGLSVPYGQFCDESIEYWDMPRLGGTVTGLRRTYQADVQRFVSSEDTTQLTAAQSQLTQIFDGLILLYYAVGHKQLEKICTKKEIVVKYIKALTETENKLMECPSQLTAVHEELEKTKQILEQKTLEHLRRVTWISVSTVDQDKADVICWLLRSLLTSLHDASVASHSLFTFVPVFYVKTCINCYTALTSFYTPSLLAVHSTAHQRLLVSYAQFLCSAFCDNNCIVSSDVQGVINQALGLFVCYSQSLAALENVQLESRVALVRKLLAPYDNNTWSHTNWILIRFWTGCGFADRCTDWSHVDTDSNKSSSVTTVGIRKPCPSAMFQQHVHDVLYSDPESGTKYIDTMLNHLNSAFSEFARLLQDLESVVVRPDGLHDMHDMRKLQICTTCFELAVSLLRVLEMVLSLAPELLLESITQHPKLLLYRLIQMLTHILNRVCASGNIFDHLISLRPNDVELPCVGHFPLLSAVAGVLVQLVVNTQGTLQQQVLTAIVSEPGYQLSSVEYLLGRSNSPPSTSSSTVVQPFSLSTHKDVSETEVNKLQQLLDLLSTQAIPTQLLEVDDELLCDICYARSKSVMFLPCRHKSCRYCIIHQMLTRNECFFCKSNIDGTVDINTSTTEYS